MDNDAVGHGRPESRDAHLPPWWDPLEEGPRTRPSPVVKPVRTRSPPVVITNPRSCQWLEGPAKNLNWCGAPVAFAGSSWCRQHEAIVYPHGRRRH
jgi:hypothetical protein